MKRQFVPVWVIGLAKQVARRRAMKAHLDGLDVAYEFIDAVDGSELSDTDVERLLAPGLWLPRGHIGCYLSHIEAYKRLVQSSASCALILEDDARLSERVIPLLERGPLTDRFDYLFLDCDNFSNLGPVYYDADARLPLFGSVLAHTLSHGPQGAHAYLITRAAAEERLAHAMPIKQPIDLYDLLPYKPRFAGVIDPRLAWLSQYGASSSTYESRAPAARHPLRWLRRSAFFYRIRDWLYLRQLRWAIDARRRISTGWLPAGHAWTRMPSGKLIMFDD